MKLYIRILNESYFSIHGLSGDDEDKVRSLLTYEIEGAKYSLAYALGKWDGSVCFFDKNTKQIPLSFLDRIVGLINQSRSKYEYHIEDHRKPLDVTLRLCDAFILNDYTFIGSDKKIVLYNHQVEAVNACLQNRRGICLAATSAGKTLITAAMIKICDEVGIKSVTIVPDGTLVRQTLAELVNVGLDAGEFTGNLKQPDKSHLVSTWQCLKNHTDVLTGRDLIIIDEAHGLTGEVLRETVMHHCKTARLRIALTGTLPKKEVDQCYVKIATGEVVYEISAKMLIDKGILAKPMVNIVKLREPLLEEYNAHVLLSKKKGIKPLSRKQYVSKYRMEYGAEQTRFRQDVVRNRWISNLVIEISSTGLGNTLILVNNIDQGKMLQEMTPNSYFINGQDYTKIEKRQEIYRMFADNDNMVVYAVYKVASTGLSINRIFNVVTIDIGKAFTKVIQTIGRGLRTSYDKTAVNVYDITSTLSNSEKHLFKRVEYYREAQYDFNIVTVDYRTYDTDSKPTVLDFEDDDDGVDNE